MVLFESALQQEGATLQRRLGDLPKQPGEAVFAGIRLRYGWSHVFEVTSDGNDRLIGLTPMNEFEARELFAKIRRS
jgi:hypothetical protein